MNRAVLFAHEAAHCIHGRPAGKIDGEFALDGRAELRAEQLLHQRGELSVNIELGRRMRSRARHFRVVCDHRSEFFRSNKIGNHDIVERIALQGSALERAKVAVSHPGLRWAPNVSARAAGSKSAPLISSASPRANCPYNDANLRPLRGQARS